MSHHKNLIDTAKIEHSSKNNYTMENNKNATKIYKRKDTQLRKTHSHI
jgi:hypothetical protein